MSLSPHAQAAIEGMPRRIREAAKNIGGGNELSRRAGMSRNTLGRWFAGETEPRYSTLLKIAQACDVSVNWLLLGEGHMKDHIEPTETTATPSKEPLHAPCQVNFCPQCGCPLPKTTDFKEESQ